MKARTPRLASVNPASNRAPAANDPRKDGSAKPIRRDVLRNRQRVVDAASEAFAERGLDVGYDEIAQRAAVGVGTVYRRFPQRSDLVVAVFEKRIDTLVDLAAAAADQPTGAAGLQWFLEEILRLQTRDRGLRDVLAGRAPRDERMLQARSRLAPAVTALLERAKREHAVRPDVTGADIAALTMSLSLLTTADQPELWQRYLVLVLDGLAPTRASFTPLPAPPPADTLMADLLHGH
ncbi:TetR family transcriptional regulator [Mycolicibacterium madagascariense]|uniref:TetR family transcriptional regulator n=1 Tax=Mycolicibacterium madagascariense TaxID=212765 RepID=A0A7I7XJD1_9MYCO|nr:TetR/AcrR family transcriptional regulator [Mycolicibacterium madagascariense]MCV7015106.1 TetR/AcrR family transcriptional regulator [Mycolicibacterium madagascariense]BBZ29309.1 TetR family transcriptional regulator [Mycolicibacterium madagascariense]